MTTAPCRPSGLRWFAPAVLALLAACSGGSGGSTPAPVVTLQPSDGTLYDLGSDPAHLLGEPLAIQFDRSMSRASVVLSGTLTATPTSAAWSTRLVTDDTLTLTPTPPGGWTQGAGQTLHVVGQAAAGGAVSGDFTLTAGWVDPVVRVSPQPPALATDQPVVVSFYFAADPATLVLGGTLVAAPHTLAWAADHGSVTVSPTTTWAAAAGQTLTVQVTGSHSAAVQAQGTFGYDVAGVTPTGQLTPASGALQPTGAITVNFSTTMDRASLSLGGTLSSGVFVQTWSTTTAPDDTLTITPALFWPAGTQTLSVAVSNLDGVPLAAPLTASYDVALNTTCGTAGGACVNATDCAVPVSTLGTWTQACFIANYASGATVTEACIQGGNGAAPGSVTTACSVCAYQFAACAVTSCQSACMAGFSTPTCVTCLQGPSGCASGFTTCSGRAM